MSLLIFLQPFLVTIKDMERHVKKSDYLEVQTGKIQMEVEFRYLRYEKIEDNRLIFRDAENGRVIFEQYQQMIRKTTSKQGHQPIMTGVKQATFTENQRVINLEVRTTEEETYDYYFFPER